MDNLLNPASNSQQDNQTNNSLWEYMQSVSPEVIGQISKPDSTEVLQVMERSITTLLGNLPPEHFGAVITTSRENLGRLLASAMLNGYFLRNVEQRMNIEKSFRTTGASSTPAD